MGKLFTALAFLLFSVPLLAQEQEHKHTHGTIKGRVYSADGQPAAFVPIGVKGSHKGSTTDEEGFFHFHLPPGKHVLTIQFIGHEPEEEEIEVHEGETTRVPDFKLRESSKELQEVEIVGKTEAQEVKESGFSVNAIETKQFANTTTDLNQLLSRSTGVRVREQGGLGSSYNFSVNGLSGKQIRYFLDGVPMEVFGSTMTLNNIPVNLAERVEVYKGVVPVHLGSDAMGGAVNVITNQKIRKYLDASYSYGSFNTHRAAVTGQYTFDSTGIVLRASAFYNYSDNNYIMRDVEVWDAGQNSYIPKDLRRFHDRYESVMGQAELGVMNKKWADVLFVGGSYAALRQDIQTGFEQKLVYGKVAREGYSYSGTLRYRKDNILLKGLHLNAFASWTFDRTLTSDTTKYRYRWDGTRAVAGSSERDASLTMNQITRPRAFARANLSYDLHPHHSFNLNYTFDRVQNQSFNQLEADHDAVPGTLAKSIVGLAYQQQLLHKRWINTFFGKYYGMAMQQPIWSTASKGYVQRDTTFRNLGYGIASRLRVLQDFGLKGSYEHAYRLQEVEEMFGDGLNVIGNPDLIPETSDNLNLGAFVSLTRGKHRFYAEGNWFYRNALHFIFLVADERSKALHYENKSNVRITGWEGEIKYSYSDLLVCSINGTYQTAINTTKYGSTASNVPEATYLNKIPNQPWLFGNTDFSIGKNNLLGKGTRLQLNWNTQYVHWFYLTWEAYGDKSGKSTIPSQYVQNASLTYSFKEGTYNLSFECRNFSNELAYDNFRLQKPGRAFSVKFRYFLK